MQLIRNIAIRGREYTILKVLPKAYEFEIKGFGTFWVHHSIRGEGRKPLKKHQVFWTITNPETGMAAYHSSFAESRAQAVARCTCRLEEIGPERFAEIIAQGAEQVREAKERGAIII